MPSTGHCWPRADTTGTRNVLAQPTEMGTNTHPTCHAPHRPTGSEQQIGPQERGNARVAGASLARHSPSCPWSSHGPWVSDSTQFNKCVLRTFLPSLISQREGPPDTPSRWGEVTRDSHQCEPGKQVSEGLQPRRGGSRKGCPGHGGVKGLVYSEMLCVSSLGAGS